eukprot:4417464-Amphidinium_carterae.2
MAKATPREVIGRACVAAGCTSIAQTLDRGYMQPLNCALQRAADKSFAGGLRTRVTSASQ